MCRGRVPPGPGRGGPSIYQYLAVQMPLRLGRTAEPINAHKAALELLPKGNAGYLAEAYLPGAEAYRAAGDTAFAGEAERSAEIYRVPK